MRQGATRWTVTGLVFVFLLAGARGAEADMLSVRLGANIPRADSDIWEQNKFETFFERDDLVGGVFGVAFDLFLTPRLSVSFAVHGYDERTTTEDSEFVDPDGFAILRDISLELTPVEASLKFLPAGRHTRIIPYVGGGVGLYFWKYRESGEFVFDRFGDPFIGAATFESSGQDVGFHGLFGLQIPAGRHWSVDLEARVFRVEGDLGRDFDPLFEPIDLSGWMLLGGVSYWF